MHANPYSLHMFIFSTLQFHNYSKTIQWLMKGKEPNRSWINNCSSRFSFAFKKFMKKQIHVRLQRSNKKACFHNLSLPANQSFCKDVSATVTPSAIVFFYKTEFPRFWFRKTSSMPSISWGLSPGHWSEIRFQILLISDFECVFWFSSKLLPQFSFHVVDLLQSLSWQSIKLRLFQIDDCGYAFWFS